jgi:hypothetical protein
VRPFFRDDPAATLRAEAASDATHAELVAMVERHEGATAGSIARRWLELQPDGASVIRDAHETAVGFVHVLILDGTHRDAGAWDPVVAAVFRHLARVDLHAGERVLVHRFLLDHATYQAVSATMQLCHEVLHCNHLFCLSELPQIAHSYVVYADMSTWEPANRIFGSLILNDDAVDVGGHRVGLAYQSFRGVTMEAWFKRVIGNVASAGSNGLRSPLASCS